MLISIFRDFYCNLSLSLSLSLKNSDTVKHIQHLHTQVAGGALPPHVAFRNTTPPPPLKKPHIKIMHHLSVSSQEMN